MQRYRTWVAALALACVSAGAYAANEIRLAAPIIKGSGGSGGSGEPLAENGRWVPNDPLLGEWVNSGAAECSIWSPAVETQVNRVEFVQTGDACSQVQIRSVQPSEYNDLTYEVRAVGEPYTESQRIEVAPLTQKAKGTLQGDFMDIPRKYRIYETNNEYWGFADLYFGRENFSNGARMGSVRYSDYTKAGVKGNYMLILQLFDNPGFATNAEAAAYIKSTFGDVYVPALGVTLESSKASFKTKAENDLQPFWPLTKAQFEAMGGRTTEGSFRIVFTNPQ